jgi:hypothetical protein
VISAMIMCVFGVVSSPQAAWGSPGKSPASKAKGQWAWSSS